jgi:hypothetical protein
MRDSRTVDLTIRKLVGESPGLSLYQIAKRTNWNIGKVDGSVRRLVNARKVFLVGEERGGRKLSLVFPSRLSPSPEIRIPRGLLMSENPVWLNHAYAYALDSHTIGIAGKPIREWHRVSQFESRLPIRRDEHTIKVTIPDNFITFYELNNHYFAKTINSNNILITVGGPIIQSKAYPA